MLTWLNFVDVTNAAVTLYARAATIKMNTHRGAVMRIFNFHYSSESRLHARHTHARALL